MHSVYRLVSIQVEMMMDSEEDNARSTDLAHCYAMHAYIPGLVQQNV